MMDFTAATKVAAHVPREARHRWGIRRASQCPVSREGMHFVTPRGRIIVKVLEGDRFEVMINRRKPHAPIVVTVEGPGIVPAIDNAFGTKP